MSKKVTSHRERFGSGFHLTDPARIVEALEQTGQMRRNQTNATAIDQLKRQAKRRFR